MAAKTRPEIVGELAALDERVRALRDEREALLASAWSGEARRVVDVGGVEVGGPRATVIAGPCSVESDEQLSEVARFVGGLGTRFLRGGAFKPRTSPYAFQGLGREGLEILRRHADRHDLRVVTEVLDPRDLDLALRYADVLQVGTRNMGNTELLALLGTAGRPVLLKRGMMATLEELLVAALRIEDAGNPRVMLCERGIRGFERWTRNTLDLTIIPRLRRLCPLPAIIDVSHAAGRKDVLLPLARAAIAAGADGLMIEVHPRPAQALSDSEQQLDLGEAEELLGEVIRRSGQGA